MHYLPCSFLDPGGKKRKDSKKSGMERANAEKVRNHWVDHRGFVCAPGDSGCVV